jgi:hypothetical protein
MYINVLYKVSYINMSHKTDNTIMDIWKLNEQTDSVGSLSEIVFEELLIS